jgi:cell division protein FtsX
MASITFDTHKFIRRLKEAGVPESQAEAMAEALRDAQGEAELVTKQDMQLELAPIKADVQLIKWMLGILLAGVASLVIKSFF